MRALLLSSAILALWACSPPASSPDAGSGEAAPSTSAAAPTPASGEELRLGRWKKTITVMGRTTTEVECVTTADLEQFATQPNSQCTSADGFQRTAEGLVYEAACTGEDGGGNIRTVMNGDMQSHYVADVTMAGAGMADGMQIRVEGAYEGACRGDE